MDLLIDIIDDILKLSIKKFTKLLVGLYTQRNRHFLSIDCDQVLDHLFSILDLCGMVNILNLILGALYCFLDFASVVVFELLVFINLFDNFSAVLWFLVCFMNLAPERPVQRVHRNGPLDK